MFWNFQTISLLLNCKNEIKTSYYYYFYLKMNSYPPSKIRMFCWTLFSFFEQERFSSRLDDTHLTFFIFPIVMGMGTMSEVVREWMDVMCERADYGCDPVVWSGLVWCSRISHRGVPDESRRPFRRVASRRVASCYSVPGVFLYFSNVNFTVCDQNTWTRLVVGAKCSLVGEQTKNKNDL